MLAGAPRSNGDCAGGLGFTWLLSPGQFCSTPRPISLQCTGTQEVEKQWGEKQ